MFGGLSAPFFYLASYLILLPLRLPALLSLHLALHLESIRDRLINGSVANFAPASSIGLIHLLLHRVRWSTAGQIQAERPRRVLSVRTSNEKMECRRGLQEGGMRAGGAKRAPVDSPG